MFFSQFGSLSHSSFWSTQYFCTTSSLDLSPYSHLKLVQSSTQSAPALYSSTDVKLLVTVDIIKSNVTFQNSLVALFAGPGHLVEYSYQSYIQCTNYSRCTYILTASPFLGKWDCFPNISVWAMHQSSMA